MSSLRIHFTAEDLVCTQVAADADPHYANARDANGATCPMSMRNASIRALRPYIATAREPRRLRVTLRSDPVGGLVMGP